MQIKLTPETDEEKANFGDVGELVHEGVKDYFLVGIKADEDADIVDFYDWRGKHQFLLGNLQYYYEVINDERRQKDARRAMTNRSPQTSAAPQVEPKNVPNLQVVGKDKKRVPQPKIVPAEVIDGDDEKDENEKTNEVEYQETTD